VHIHSNGDRAFRSEHLSGNRFRRARARSRGPAAPADSARRGRPRTQAGTIADDGCPPPSNAPPNACGDDSRALTASAPRPRWFSRPAAAGSDAGAGLSAACIRDGCLRPSNVPPSATGASCGAICHCAPRWSVDSPSSRPCRICRGYEKPRRRSIYLLQGNGSTSTI
jgi:hypothetical protein